MDNLETLKFDFVRSDGRPLPRNHIEEEGVLTVNDVGPDAEGEYACIVMEKINEEVLFTIYATLQIVGK